METAATPEAPEDYFTVEKIIDKRVRDGQVEYLLKWEGYGEEDSTWTKEHDLNCPELVAAFEEKRRRRQSKKQNKERLPLEKSKKGKFPAKKKAKEDRKGPEGFERNLEPEEIIGAAQVNGELMFLMKWKGSDEADLVTSREAKVKCPQVVIKFYEDRLTWAAESNVETEDESGEE